MSRVGGLVCVLVALWAGVGSGYAAAESPSGAGEETMRIMHVVLARGCAAGTSPRIGE